MNLIIRLLITAVTAFFLTKLLPGVTFSGFSSAIFFAIVLAILNVFVKPILKFFGTPLTILTLGLFSLVINAIVVLLADYFLDGMKIDGFVTAVVFSILLSFISTILDKIFISKKR